MPPVNIMNKTLIALALTQALAAQAATINIDGGCLLQDAIRSANTDTAVAGCEAGSGADVIDIPTQTITLTNAAVDGEQFGDSGLPLIDSEITILGNGSTIQRVSGDAFRIMALDSNTSASLTMESITLTGGLADDSGEGYGGAIYAGFGTSLVLNNATITGNSSSLEGGGVYSYNAAHIEINDSQINDNSATRYGGGVSVFGDLHVQINRTTINGNTAGSGGGLALSISRGPATITDSTISNNYLVDGNPSGEKGAGFSTYRGSFTIENSTISSNTASGSGSGMYVNASKLLMVNTTIANNQDGGTIVTAGNPTYVNTITLINSVVASPVAYSSCSIFGGGPEISVFNSTNSNWFTDDTCDGEADGDPLLGMLGNNGGPTLTHNPAPSSGLIDAASAHWCPDQDQRGAERDASGLFFPIKTQDGRFAAISIDGKCDIGSLEYFPI